MSGPWVEMRAMMSVFDGLCLSVFFLFCVMIAKSCCVLVICSSLWDMRCCVGGWLWGVGFVLCRRGPGRVWFLFVVIWFWVRGVFVVSWISVVGVMLAECVGRHSRLRRLCVSLNCVRVGVERCTGSDFGVMSGQ